MSPFRKIATGSPDSPGALAGAAGLVSAREGGATPATGPAGVSQRVGLIPPSGSPAVSPPFGPTHDVAWVERRAASGPMVPTTVVCVGRCECGWASPPREWHATAYRATRRHQAEAQPC